MLFILNTLYQVCTSTEDVTSYIQSKRVCHTTVCSCVLSLIHSWRYIMAVATFRATVTPQFTGGSYGAAFTYEYSSQ